MSDYMYKDIVKEAAKILFAIVAGIGIVILIIWMLR